MIIDTTEKNPNTKPEVATAPTDIDTDSSTEEEGPHALM